MMIQCIQSNYARIAQEWTNATGGKLEFYRAYLYQRILHDGSIPDFFLQFSEAYMVDSINVDLFAFCPES
jgi:hypothetical protein